MPSSLASVVAGVVGLDESYQLVHTNTAGRGNDPDAPPSAAFVNAPPCSTYWAEKLATAFTNPYGPAALPYVPCGYTPQQVKGAYGLGATTWGWQRANGSHHRCLRVAHDFPGCQPVVNEPRPSTADTKPV